MDVRCSYEKQKAKKRQGSPSRCFGNVLLIGNIKAMWTSTAVVQYSLSRSVSVKWNWRERRWRWDLILG